MSTSAPSLRRNATVTLTAQLGIFVLGLAMSVVVAHALGPAGRGRYYVPVTAVMTCFVVVHLSVEMATTYFFAERIADLRALASVAAAAALVLAPLGVGLLLGAFAVAGDTIFTGVQLDDVLIAAAALPFLLHATWMVNLLVLGGRLARAQLALVGAAVVQAVIIGTLAVVDRLGVHEVLVAYVANAAAMWVLLVVWSRDVAPALPTRDAGLVRRVVGHGMRIHVGFVAYFLMLRSDVFLVNGYLGTHEVGLYSLAVMFAELLWTVSTPVATAALPLQTTPDVAESGRVTLRTARLCLLVTGGLSLTIAVTMGPLLPVIYGDAFADAYAPLVVLLPGVCAMAVVRPLWNRMLREGRPDRITAVALAAFALNVGLNVVLLPTVGLVGASIASSASYLLLAVVLGVWTTRAVGAPFGALLPGRDDATAIVRAVGAARAAVLAPARRRA